MQQAVDMDEVLALTRRDDTTPTARRVVAPKESGLPVRYATTPFRKYVAPPRPTPEPADPRRLCWRERFENAGLRIAVAPYMDLDGPRWHARLDYGDRGRRDFAVCLDRGIWSDGRAGRRDRPWDELLEHVDRIVGKPDPPEVVFVRECVRRGIELQGELLPNGCQCGLYRGIWLAIYPAGQSVQVGKRVDGGREYKHYPPGEGLKLLDLELRAKAATLPTKGRLF